MQENLLLELEKNDVAKLHKINKEIEKILTHESNLILTIEACVKNEFISEEHINTRTNFNCLKSDLKKMIKEQCCKSDLYFLIDNHDVNSIKIAFTSRLFDNSFKLCTHYSNLNVTLAQMRLDIIDIDNDDMTDIKFILNELFIIMNCYCNKMISMFI